MSQKCWWASIRIPNHSSRVSDHHHPATVLAILLFVLSDYRSTLTYEPFELRFGTSGRRGRVIDLTQLEIYINVLGELTYLQSLPRASGGIVCGDQFYFAHDLRPSSTAFDAGGQGR